LGLTREQQAGRILRMADANVIAAADLSACHKVRERVDEQAFDRTFKWPRPVAHVRALRNQELSRALRNGEKESILPRRGMDPQLHDFQFDIDDSVQLQRAKRPENDDVVQPVYELRGEPAPSRRDTRGGDLAVQFCLAGAITGNRLRETPAGVYPERSSRPRRDCWS
jgi:hypothetical protein